MKRLLMSILLVVATASVFAQEKEDVILTSHKNFLSKYDSRKDEWVAGEIVRSTIKFKFTDDYVMASDESKSLYRIVENFPSKKYDDKEVIKARCLDEQNRDCFIMLVDYDDSRIDPVIIILYKNNMLTYVID